MLKVKSLSKAYSKVGNKAVNGISFKVEKGRFFTLLGPSGCGKTTTLRCIAGLEVPEDGEIFIGDDIVYSSERRLLVPPNKRKIGMVFQSYAIWPHMTVCENVAFPLKIQKKFSKKEIIARVKETLDIVKMGEFEKRLATQLSGGQQQRVALARALVNNPKLLLLDEPLSNLDAKLRAEMRVEIKKLQSGLGITTIYVTHDQSEALSMSDTIAVLDKGDIVQIGSPKDIYETPANPFVAKFIGSTNLIEGSVSNKIADNRYEVNTEIGKLTGINKEYYFNEGELVNVAIRPEVITISLNNENPTSIKAIVEASLYAGDYHEYQVAIGSTKINVKSKVKENITEKSNVFIDVLPEDCYLLKAN